MRRIPRRLGKDPIIEAIAELRFKSAGESGGVRLLPGFLYSRLRDRYSKLEELPAAQLPSQLRAMDPNLSYVAQFRLVGKDSAIMVGDQVLSVSVAMPYPGWKKLKPVVLDIWGHAKDSGLVGLVERISVKYVNVLDAPLGTDHISLTKLGIRLDDHDVTSEPTSLRTEIRRGSMVSIIQVVSQATTSVIKDGAPQAGLVVDIDSIYEGPFDNFWDRHATLLDDAHDFEKELFFRLLTDETLAKYEPEY